MKRELNCAGYLRYVDNFALFADSKGELWAWKHAIVERLARLRLTIHDSSAQVIATERGIPWLGMVVFPDHRRLTARKVCHTTRKLRERYDAYCAAALSFAEFRASLRGFINRARHADTLGLRRHVLVLFLLKLG